MNTTIALNLILSMHAPRTMDAVMRAKVIWNRAKPVSVIPSEVPTSISKNNALSKFPMIPFKSPLKARE